MLVTGIIMIPTVMATPAAVQDLTDLQNVINSAASAIADPNNPNRGFGFNLFGGSGQMGTADLVNNITNTILRGKFQLDTNRTSWLLPNTTINSTLPTPPTLATPTLPLTASLALPTSIPTTTPTLDNLTIDLTSSYMEYIQSMPNLANSLITLGRAYHREMNSPVNEAVAGLQQSLTTFQTALLESDLISAQAVIRTIRASSSLESAATAWSRFLNLPGGGGGDDDDAGSASPSSPSVPGVQRPGVLGRAEAKRPPPGNGRFYSHFELWNRSEPRARVSTEGKFSPHDLVVQAEEKRVSTTAAEKARVGRPFVV
ncbi:hypothetical protein BKA58DRAFT_321653 [Alternaria rosae]|uniref:uncharacterized protein n=1 Tax=Alternaria rosae TaxID=1187941 RepID=UPI001E8D222F|nr:uncharacterized protein BKA58DRAFT_326977 [Alternaria rosae]XP_046021714.1 uncharacterized protein BKA58DRAFT_321653 [Alternaria rosae]KAH6843511.1 hypothetical protein BKA58DRAFT_326977 [Alternaria rosae]KAH6864768.1 hypothetical protein BKA58DRAFT_321653 [Alternaria rosae]